MPTDFGFGPTPGTNRPASQATTIEAARVTAEVQAMVIAAKRDPRDIDVALDEMRAACRMHRLASAAFFEYPRGVTDDGSPNIVSGVTVVLARELARCWGNVIHGITELERTDDGTEMQAWAWDLQANTRAQDTFTVRHRWYISGREITGDRDLAENSLSVAGRRTRQTILNVLPDWFVAEAADICDATLHKPTDEDEGKSIEDQAEAAIASFASLGLGVTQVHLETRVLSARTKWDQYTLNRLRQLYRQLARREMTAGELFPDLGGVTDTITVDTITGGKR